MKYEGKGTIAAPQQRRGSAMPRVGRLALLAAIAALAGLAFAAFASANNLDRKTATEAAKELARQDCRNTTGCEDYFVRDLHRVSRHKARGKIHVISHKNRRRFDCVRRIAVKLDHENGKIYSAKGPRDCEDLGPQ